MLGLKQLPYNFNDGDWICLSHRACLHRPPSSKYRVTLSGHSSSRVPALPRYRLARIWFRPCARCLLSLPVQRGESYLQAVFAGDASRFAAGQNCHSKWNKPAPVPLSLRSLSIVSVCSNHWQLKVQRRRFLCCALITLRDKEKKHNNPRQMASTSSSVKSANDARRKKESSAGAERMSSSQDSESEESCQNGSSSASSSASSQDGVANGPGGSSTGEASPPETVNGGKRPSKATSRMNRILSNSAKRWGETSGRGWKRENLTGFSVGPSVWLLDWLNLHMVVF